MTRKVRNPVKAALLAWVYATLTTMAVTVVVFLGMMLIGAISSSTSGQTIELSEWGPGLMVIVPLLLMAAAFSLGYAALAFGLGLGIAAPPVWWGLHSLGWTGPRTFTGIGALTTVIGGGWIFMDMEGGALALILAIPGAVAGWTLWRVGYGHSPKLKAQNR